VDLIVNVTPEGKLADVAAIRSIPAQPAFEEAVREAVRDWVYTRAGISMSSAKKPLVTSRLLQRLAHHRLRSFSEYYRLISHGGSSETQIALDLLTTNETYFFREPKHFEFLRERVLPACRRGVRYRVWSAACSSGEEPWSIAMTFAEALPEGEWEIVASDLSTRVLERARDAQYAMERATHLPPPLLKKYCLRGVEHQAGTFRIERSLRQHVQFMQVNLVQPLPDVGTFDLIFLRNVMIYFDVETKARVVRRLCEKLRPGGYFFCGHAETLHGVDAPLSAVQPAIYQRT